ncbi:MAG: hypothetical protein AB1330_01380 [Bacillota bacterium]
MSMRLIPLSDTDTWGLSETALNALQRAEQIQAARHGLYASIPIICKLDRCPYAQTCRLIDEGLAPAGERCPLEIAAMQRLFQAYMEELEVEDDAAVDIMLIRELVSIDIAILRCENKLAVDADFLQEVAVAVTPKGHIITKPEIHKAAEYKDKLLEKRHRVLQLLNSTRKDKAGSKHVFMFDPSTRAVELLEKAREFLQAQKAQEVIVDVGSESGKQGD